jgi:hypothetical protein
MGYAMPNKINGLYMPLINNAFPIIAPLIYASALINNDFMPLVAHWWREWWRISAPGSRFTGSRQDRARIAL